MKFYSVTKFTDPASVSAITTARYYALSFASSATDSTISPRAFMYMAAGVAVLSALIVFAFLCERDHSLLLSATRHARVLAQPAPAQPRPIVSADTQPAPDSVTRVTVPTVSVTPSGAVSNGASEASIPGSHTDPAALENHGTQHIAFNLARSRRFQRLGPVSVGVWKIDARHKVCDISLLVDGRRTDHKHVSVDTPVSVSSNKFARPLQLVVSSLDRNHISGYLSEPKATR